MVKVYWRLSASVVATAPSFTLSVVASTAVPSVRVTVSPVKAYSEVAVMLALRSSLIVTAWFNALARIWRCEPSPVS